MSRRPLVFIESPFAGDAEHRLANRTYLKECILDAIKRDENPYASHGFFTQYLDDTIKDERRLGIELGNEWRELCDCSVFYVDLGISDGMILGIEYCKIHELKYAFRRIS